MVADIPADLLAILREVKDPEIDVVDVVELGIVRRAEHLGGKRVLVTITPTYSGCPAMQMIENEIGAALKANGFIGEVKTTFNPPWTTDWISDETREKLRSYGISPPGKAANELTLVQIKGSLTKEESPLCPLCNSNQVTLQSQFGSTACKSLYTCHQCQQPFEHFKRF